MITEEPQRLQTRIGRLIHDNYAAEDLAQDALVRAIRGAASLRGPAEEALLCKWLDRIACNVAFNHTRDQGRKPAVASIDNDETLPHETGPQGDTDPAAIVTRSETEQELTELMSALPPDFRTVFI